MVDHCSLETIQSLYEIDCILLFKFALQRIPHIKEDIQHYFSDQQLALNTPNNYER